MTPADTGFLTYRVRVDLDRAEPPIWRRLDLRSDLPLDVVHLVLQAAFDWENRHLYRFAVGGGPFEAGSTLILCDQDEDEQGRLASHVSLDDVLRHPGDRLAYVYDFGDCWRLTIELEQVMRALDDSPAAAVLDGERAAPPEDSGGITDADQLADGLTDPGLFEPNRINAALQAPLFVALTRGVDSRLVALLSRLPDGRLLDDLEQLSAAPTTVDGNERSANLAAYQWFLDRAKGDGIPLTSAGYMKPADVTAASEVVPAMADWIGKNNREANCVPLLDFRKSLQALGLLRKQREMLLLTRAGAAAQRDSALLWRRLSTKLVPTNNDSFECHATLLLLAQAGASTDGVLRFEAIANALTQLGWRDSDGGRVRHHDLYRLTARDVLLNICAGPRTFAEYDRISPTASALARAAVRRPVL